MHNASVYFMSDLDPNVIVMRNYIRICVCRGAEKCLHKLSFRWELKFKTFLRKFNYKFAFRIWHLKINCMLSTWNKSHVVKNFASVELEASRKTHFSRIGTVIMSVGRWICFCWTRFSTIVTWPCFNELNFFPFKVNNMMQLNLTASVYVRWLSQ